MAVQLYEHQKKAVKELKNGNILCGGVGTGKSRTALAYFYTKVCGGQLPSKNLREEPFVPETPLYIITTARKRDTLEWDEECIPFLLKDYVVDSWNNIAKYKDVVGAFFIFDEQRVVGNGAWVKTFLKITKNNRWILLSATPGDTWMDYIPVMMANGFYKNRSEFIRKHVIYSPYTKYPKVLKYVGVKELYEKRKLITVNMHYDKKASQHHNWIKVGYDESLYFKVLKQRWNVYKDLPVKNISELCYTLRKVVNEDDRRLEAIRNILNNHKRIILFYNFNYELDKMIEFLESEDILYKQWNGHIHQPVPLGDSWVYLVQYSSGSEGWNCVETDTIVFYSQSYSYKATHQASGRIDRLNTPFSDLYYYHIFSDAPIDKAIKKCVMSKKDFNEKSFIA